MGLKSILAKPIAALVASSVRKWSLNPVASQQKVFRKLIDSARSTRFGKEHDFGAIQSYEDFKQRVPVRDYEGFRDYIDAIKNGAADVLWPGKPIYFCKTSGTTSGTKYIPITKDSIHNHISSARNALLMYIHASGNSTFLDGNLIFLSGSPVLSEVGGIPLGRLSGIVNHHVPGYLRRNQLPSYETNCIEDWETKVRKIADETIDKPMALISGIPSWVQMYFEILQEKRNGQAIKDIFPDFSVFVYGGVNYEPYRARFEKLIGKKVDSVELFPASEGFFAYQDKQPSEGLLLLLDTGIFYEFIPVDEFTVAPQVTPTEGLPYHEWFVEFGHLPADPERFRMKIDEALQQRNIYYKDLIKGNVLKPLVIRSVEKDSFIHYMKTQGKLGGQNKVPRLSNDRKIADALSNYISNSWGN
jgi:hypothetical protein